MPVSDKESAVSTNHATTPPGQLTDDEVVARVLNGDLGSFEWIMRRYNQRLFRLARSVMGDDGEAEDVVQETYVRAFEHLGQFAGTAAFSTWLTKIALHAALARRDQRRRLRAVDVTDPENQEMLASPTDREADHAASTRELGVILTQAVDELPDDLRTVFALRMIEGLGTKETADCLELTASNVKVRLHRARSLLRERIDAKIGIGVRQLYQFGGERCNRIVHAVLVRLTAQESASGTVVGKGPLP